MLKSLSIFLPLFFFWSETNATTVSDTTIIKPKSQLWFHQQYGTDTISRAIIDYFFLKRKKATPPLIASSIVSGAGIAAIIITSGEGSNTGMLPLVTIISSAVLFFFFVDLIKYSKKELIKTLNYYQSGKGVPKWLMKLSSWQKYISSYEKR